MSHSRNDTTQVIVFQALRKYAAAIREDVKNYLLDPSKSEELDEAIRLTRTLRLAATLVGAMAIYRIAEYQEEVLEPLAR